MDTKDDIWAIVVAGQGLYLGVINKSQDDEDPLDVMGMGGLLRLSPAYELYANTMQDPQQPGKIGKHMMAVSFAGTYSTKTPLYIRADGIQFLKDMEEDDRNRYKKLVVAADAIADEWSKLWKAQESNIHLATQMPRRGNDPDFQ